MRPVRVRLLKPWQGSIKTSWKHSRLYKSNKKHTFTFFTLPFVCYVPKNVWFLISFYNGFIFYTVVLLHICSAFCHNNVNASAPLWLRSHFDAASTLCVQLALIPKRTLTDDTLPCYKYTKFKPHYVFSHVLKRTSVGLHMHARDIFRSKRRFHAKEPFEERTVVVFWSSIWFVHGNTTDLNSSFLYLVLAETQISDKLWTLWM